MRVMHGALPKVSWLNVGNAGTNAVAGLFRIQFEIIDAFVEHAEAGLLAPGFAPGASEVRRITGGKPTATLQLSAVLKITVLIGWRDTVSNVSLRALLRNCKPRRRMASSR